MYVILLVLPDFMLIALGWVLLHKLNFSADFFRSAEKLVYFVLFPALLFQSISQAPISPSGAWLLFQSSAALCAFGVFMAWLAIPALRPNKLAHASVAQCAYRFNTYIGLSIAGSLGGAPAQSIMAVIVGFAVPLANVAAVHGLARQSNGKVFSEIIRNPFIIATVAGLLFNLLQIPIPKPIDTALARLGACALAIGLLCVGATLSLHGARAAAALMGWMIAVRLLIMPIGALAIGWVLDLSLMERQMLFLFSTLPASSSAHVLSARLGGDARLTAVTMSIGTLFSAITIPLWLMLFTT